jgi:hypothetical protein
MNLYLIVYENNTDIFFLIKKTSYMNALKVKKV